MEAVKPSLQVESVQWFDENPILNVKGENAYPGCDGAVWYLVLKACDCPTPCDIACSNHPGMHHLPIMQPFNRSGGDLPDKRPIWQWDGNRLTPTLNPSFLCHYPIGAGQVLVIHSFLRAGKIDLCSDSTVEVTTSPQPCSHETWPEAD